MKNLIAIAALAIFASPALAEQKDDVLAPLGVSVTVGGGVGGFTDSMMRDMTGVAGGWGVRVTVGSHTLVGFEAAYMGGLQSIDSLGLDDNAQLLSSAVEADLRLNVLRPFSDFVLQPYLFMGGAWKRYDLERVDTNVSDVRSRDDVVEIPMGIGIGCEIQRFVFDLRGAYRPAWDADLMPGADEGTGLASWSAALHIGYDF